jgi:hypothetical protein
MAEATQTQNFPITTMGIVAPIVGWLIPGAGHILVKRPVRGLILMFSIVVLFVFGILMEGKVYTPNTGDVLDMLSFVGDLGNGVLYFAARIFHWGKGAIHMASASYGTIFIVVAGLLNIICAVDAHHIAIGKKK